MVPPGLLGVLPSGAETLCRITNLARLAATDDRFVEHQEKENADTHVSGRLARQYIDIDRLNITCGGFSVYICVVELVQYMPKHGARRNGPRLI